MPLNHSDIFINYILYQVSFLRARIKSRDQQINSLLEYASRLDDIYLSKKGAMLPENAKQTNIKQKSDQEQIPSTIPMPTPKKNQINVDNNETILISNGNNLKKKVNHIVSVAEKELPKNTQSKNSSNKKINYPPNEKFVDNSKSVIILGDTMIKHLNGS